MGSSAVGLLRNTVLQPAATQMTSALASSSSTSSKGESSSGRSDFIYQGTSEGTTAHFQDCDRRNPAVPYPESFRTRQHQMADTALFAQQEFHAFGSNLGIDLSEESRQQSPVENSLPQGIQGPSLLELNPAAQGINIPMQAEIDPHFASQTYLDRFPMYEKRVEPFLQDYNGQASNGNGSDDALQHYQLLLMLLEQQNKKRSLQIRQINEKAVSNANVNWTPSDTDGQAVVALLSDVNLDLEEPTSSICSTQDSSHLEPLFETKASASSIVESTVSEPPFLAVQSTSSSLNPSSLIPEFNSLSQMPLSTRTLNAPAIMSHPKEDMFPVYAVQSFEGEIKPWVDILSRYQDEVWGDILPLAREARKEDKIANAGGKPLHNGTSALRRLAMVFGHVRDSPCLEATPSLMTPNDRGLGKGHQ